MPLPTDDNVEFLVCEAIRQTPDGKFDLAGYYPMREIKIEPNTQLPVGLNLTFVFILKDGEGRFRGVHRIADPLGAELHKFDLPEVVKPAGLGHVLMLPVAGIPIARSGHYPIILELDGQPYRRSVRIFQ
jgi:hypothetical protein